MWYEMDQYILPLHVSWRELSDHWLTHDPMPERTDDERTSVDNRACGPPVRARDSSRMGESQPPLGGGTCPPGNSDGDISRLPVWLVVDGFRRDHLPLASLVDAVGSALGDVLPGSTSL